MDEEAYRHAYASGFTRTLGLLDIAFSPLRRIRYQTAPISRPANERTSPFFARLAIIPPVPVKNSCRPEGLIKPRVECGIASVAESCGVYRKGTPNVRARAVHPFPPSLLPRLGYCSR